MKKALLWLMCANLFWVQGCPSDDNDPDSDNSESDKSNASTEPVDCSSSVANPYAGTCVDDFMAECFDPNGACTGSASAAGIDFEWVNGARVETEIDLSNLEALAAGMSTTITKVYDSNGTLCATGETLTSASDPTNATSDTTYTRESDGQTITYTSNADGDITVTCPDSSMFTVTSSEAKNASTCQYGSEAGQCEIDDLDGAAAAM